MTKKAAKPPDKGVKSGKQSETESSATTEHSEQDDSATGMEQPQPTTQEQMEYAMVYDKSVVVLELPRWLYWLLAAMVLFAALVIGAYTGTYIQNRLMSSNRGMPDQLLGTVESIGPEGVQLFNQHDRNNDGYLTLEEFEPLIHRLLGSGANISAEGFETDQPIEDDDEIVTLRSYFKPLVLSSLTKDLGEYFGSLNSLIGLRGWTKTTTDWMNFGVRHFKPFLPPDDSYIQDLGKVYEIMTYQEGLVNTVTLSSNRYYPYKVKDEVLGIHRLLTMFHPRPFLITRFQPWGSVASVRAVNDQYIDIVFRIHAEFQLNEPPYYPFWFTPSQFTGHLVISRDYNHILYFRLYVPNHRLLNVDMEWLNGPREAENMEVDIGYMPLMELNITAPSIGLPADELFMKELEVPEEPGLLSAVNGLKWKRELPEEDVMGKLEVKMYPFKQVPYYNLTTALEKATVDHKLIHSIILWGALDDQSC